MKSDFEGIQGGQKIDPAGFIRWPVREVLQVERPIDSAKTLFQCNPFQPIHVGDEIAHGQLGFFNKSFFYHDQRVPGCIPERNYVLF
jgi:hypothetical protein